MSKKKGALVIALYFVAACVLGACIQFSDPLAFVGKKYPITQFISASVGAGTTIFLTAAIVPGLIWLIGLFRPRPNRPNYTVAALVLWPIFGMTVTLLMFVGNRADREETIKAEFRDSGFTADQRKEAIISAKSTCIASQKQSSINQGSGITDQQITAYCDCYAGQIAKVVTMEEMRYVARNGQFPESFKDKINQSGATCSRAVLLKK
jgi:hypothetical protein